jgi:hypothetical protein
MSINICFSIRRLYSRFWRPWNPWQDQQYWKSCPVLHVLKNNQDWFVEALRVMFANFLMEVLDACRNVGVEVVATVCHMGANSVRPWNSWMFLKRYQSSRWVTKKLQQCLNPISLNAHNLVIEHDVTNVGFEVFVNGERPSAQICWRGNKLTK